MDRSVVLEGEYPATIQLQRSISMIDSLINILATPHQRDRS